MPSRHNGNSELPPARRPVPQLLKWATGIAALVVWTLLIGASVGGWSDTTSKADILMGGIAVTLALLTALIALVDWLNCSNQHRHQASTNLALQAHADGYGMVVGAVGRRTEELAAQLATHDRSVGVISGMIQIAVDKALEAGIAGYWKGLADGKLGIIDPPTPRKAHPAATGTEPKRRGPVSLVSVDS